jgi:hypothetical protein
VESNWKAAVWLQFGAALDMLENALVACPDELWHDRSRQPEFWYLVFHTLFWLDLYLTDPSAEFVPPHPFTLAELDPAGLMPERVYLKDELHTYLLHCRKKCRATIRGLTDEQARRRRVIGSVDAEFAELLLYTMRHVQHHAAQLNLLLRQTTDAAPRWVGKTWDPL